MGGHKHSKNGGYHFGYHEKVKANKAGMGTATQRLGSDSQLPFGYCSLSLQPAVEPVVTPSGHIYSREAILEYLLVKTQELKRQSAEYDNAQAKADRLERSKEEAARAAAVNAFVRREDAAASSSSSSAAAAAAAVGGKRKASEASTSAPPRAPSGTLQLTNAAAAAPSASAAPAATSSSTALVLMPDQAAAAPAAAATERTARSAEVTAPAAASAAASTEESAALRKKHKLIDETPREAQIEGLRSVCPWIPQFTPEAPDAPPPPPPRRPSSPFSGQPLRAKDLIPINLERESGGSGSSSSSGGRSSVDNNGTSVRFICPVSKDTVVAQPMVLIKPTGAVMTEAAAKTLAYPSMRCPITSRKFTMADVLPLTRSATGFASTGAVEAKKYKPSIN